MGPIEKAKSEKCLPKVGTPVKISEKIMESKETGGFLVKDKYIISRRPNQEGIYRGWVPGAGGDLWWIEHQDGTIGAYMYNELQDVS